MRTCRREDFFDFDGWSYLNSAYQGPLPRVSAAAIEEALELKRRPYTLPETLLVELPSRVRALAARLIGAATDEIALATGATHGLNLAAAGLPLKPGDEVLLGPGEFPSNLFPWRYHSSRRGYTARVIETAGPYPQVDDYARAATDRTRALAVAQVSYSTGYRSDLPALSRLCRERGWYLVVDACQAVGSIAFSVADFQPDILATGGYKWLLSPYGTGFTYVRQGLIGELQVPVVYWMGLESAEDFNALSRQTMTFAHSARRFDVPETASFLNLFGMERSLEYLLDVGVETVERHHTALLQQLADGLPAGFKLSGERSPEHRSGIVFLSGKDADATAAAFQQLREAKIHTSLRENRIRVSPNIYNDESDIDRLLSQLGAS
jgi:selenocysteine lyase/cysteine desulfurase